MSLLVIPCNLLCWPEARTEEEALAMAQSVIDWAAPLLPHHDLSLAMPGVIATSDLVQDLISMVPSSAFKKLTRTVTPTPQPFTSPLP